MAYAEPSRPNYTPIISIVLSDLRMNFYMPAQKFAPTPTLASFSALLYSHLKAFVTPLAHLLRPFHKLFCQNDGYRMRNQSHLGSVYSVDNSPS